VYSPEPLSTRSDAEARAREFGGLVSRLLTATVSRQPVRLRRHTDHADWTRWTWEVGAFSPTHLPTAVRLSVGTHLFAMMELGVRENAGQFWLTTLASVYRWQATSDGASWIVRWEYERDPIGTKPPAHLHVNATPARYPEARRDFPKLHLPTGRVAIEDVIAFLLDEQGLPETSPNARAVLAEGRAIFRAIQRERAREGDE
jgi:hypothetical protein